MMFRKMEMNDIPSGLSLCRSAGWNQLSRDWEIFLTLDPQGNEVITDDSGNIIGTVTTIRYDNHFAWIGMVLVDPAHQRKGIGLGLLEQANDMLKNENCVKLDATPAGRELYRKIGFIDEYGLSRMLVNTLNPQHLHPSPTATALSADDMESVRTFDRDVFGGDRMTLLRWMLQGSPELAFKVGERNQIKGYCFGRPGYRFMHIGPIVATDWEVARDLVSAAIKNCGDRPVIIDVTLHNKSWLAWLSLLGFAELRPFIRMFKGKNQWPRLPENQFAILGPEFG